mgnify:CR=1 FL=1
MGNPLDSSDVSSFNDACLYRQCNCMLSHQVHVRGILQQCNDLSVSAQFSFVKLFADMHLKFALLQSFSYQFPVADCNDKPMSVTLSCGMDFHVDFQSFALTGSFAPHAVHFKNKTRSSLISLVSGLSHSLQTTKSRAYC